MRESIAKPSKPANTNMPVMTVTAMRFGAKKLVDAPPSITSNTTSRANSVSSNTTRKYRFFNCPALAAPYCACRTNQKLPRACQWAEKRERLGINLDALQKRRACLSKRLRYRERFK